MTKNHTVVIPAEYTEQSTMLRTRMHTHTHTHRQACEWRKANHFTVTMMTTAAKL